MEAASEGNNIVLKIDSLNQKTGEIDIIFFELFFYDDKKAMTTLNLLGSRAIKKYSKACLPVLIEL